jgi:hypothetical protein
MVKTVYLFDDNMEVDLEGKIRNLPRLSQALTPVFEAVVNSMDAIKERKNGRGQITVKIIRDSTEQVAFNDDIDSNTEVSRKLPEIRDFIIEDDGVGFTEENWKSFNKSDSSHKLKSGGKGVGRFDWLKAFDKVEISSIFQENGSKLLREFEFNTKGKGVHPKILEKTDNEIKTIVKLKNFKEEYREDDTAYKSTSKIAQRILEHFLAYYINKSAPKIIIDDESERTKEKINLDHLFKNYDIEPDSLSINGRNFSIYHVELPTTRKGDAHRIVYCANKRDVKTSNLNNQLGTFGIDKGGKPVYYSAYVVGDYLDKKVNSLRNTFDFPKKDYVGMDGDYEICELTIQNKILEKIKIHLADYLKEIKNEKEKQVAEIISKNPILRSIPQHNPDIYDELKPRCSEVEAMQVLFKAKAQNNYNIQEKYTNLLKTQIKSYEEAKEKCVEIFSELGRNEKDNLAEYVVWRNCVIQLLENKLKSDDLKEYQQEKIIHDIILPRKTSTNQLEIENTNLWLFDDQLLFHEFAVSDKPLKDYTSSNSDLRPDIIVFSEGDMNQNLDEISIFELKRPMVKSVPKDPISYMYDVIEEIKDVKNKKWLSHGRRLMTHETTRFNCYVLCDVTQDITKIKRDHSMQQLNYNLGYYKYEPELHAHVWILSFNEMLKVAKKRNMMFLSKLNLNK